MKNISPVTLLLAILACCSMSIAAPAAKLCDDPQKRHLLEASTTGEVIEGPACVQVNVNALRYSAELVKTISFTSGSNLSSIFPEAGSPSGGGKCPQTPKSTLALAFQGIWERVNGKDCQDPANPAKTLSDQGIADLFYEGRQAMNRRVSASTDDALGKVKDTIIQSDEVMAAGKAPAVLKLVGKDFQDGIKDAIDNAANWKAADDILASIHGAQRDLAALPERFARPVSGTPAGADHCDTDAWQDWFSQCGGESRYKLLQDQLAKLETDAGAMATGSDEAQKMASKAGLLAYWSHIVSTLDEKVFQVETEAPCGVLFNKNKQTAIKLILTDRVPMFSGQTPSQKVTDPLVTVECGSPFSISAGVGFSTIEDREFSLVKSAPSDGGDSVLRFGESTRSPVHPMPLGMAHARLMDWDRNKYALHASFGVAAAIKGQDAGGSNAEYLTGMSVSFFRTIYLTGGLHIGQQAKLGGGFKVGDIVPPDITEPPVQKGYKVGFGFAVTFTKP